MIKSMTGYGKSEVMAVGGRITIEIRSVNHRYGEISIKLPRIWYSFENEIRKGVAGRLKRGKIEVFIQQLGGTEAGYAPAVNISLARGYCEAFLKLKDELGLADPVTLPLILAQKDVLVAGAGEGGDEQTVLKELMAAVTSAVESLDAMRLCEGEALLEDIQARREHLVTLIAVVAARSPQATAECAARLRERVAQLLSEGELDQGRIAQEIALLADRADITEELVRFRSHLQQLGETLANEEPVGRKLDFILQEMNREVNTIGSKANDADIALSVVEMKAELEKIREQIQNVE